MCYKKTHNSILFLVIFINFSLWFDPWENLKNDEVKVLSFSFASQQQNRLAHQKSPYLLQHADNPVDWYPWGEEAFKKAQREDKPIFLSIGYSTCHWCHVMESESFENSQIAKILNDYFVPIKVDREERPDIDNLYMPAVVLLTGSGGWPVSLFLTPDKKPFAGGTYFPPESSWGRPGFKEMLNSIKDFWQKDREKALRASDIIVKAMQDNSTLTRRQKLRPEPETEISKSAYDLLKRQFDFEFGGFGRSPKFPLGQNSSFLLRYWKRTKEVEALAMVEKTLQAMAKGGLHDHLGGGFHRYSTDDQWLLPHFEKMLYDQAILSKVYLEMYQITKKEEYSHVARDIFDFVLRDLMSDQGGFYSAIDADSLEPDKKVQASSDSHQKKEGAFYLWTYEEISKILKEDAVIFNFYYGIRKGGNISLDPPQEFLRKNILFIANDLKSTAIQYSRSVEQVEDYLQEAKRNLYLMRSKRPYPHVDDKILVDWNGLMISSLAFGSRVLREPRYLKAAEKSAQFILKHLVRKDGRLLHRYRDGEAAVLATIEDYAFFIHGLIDLYEATFNIHYLKEAKRLTEGMIRLFWDNEVGGFYFTALDAESLLFRKKEFFEGAIPSGNSLAFFDLLRLSRIFLNQDWEKKLAIMKNTTLKEVNSYPAGYCQFLIALEFALGPSIEVIIAGEENSKETQEALAILYDNFLPHKVVVFHSSHRAKATEMSDLLFYLKEQGSSPGKTIFYVCQNRVCKRPTSDLNEFKVSLGLIQK